MCASYGLDPRFVDADGLLAGDAALIEELRSWAQTNQARTLRPTGRNMRNLNPVVGTAGDARVLEQAWWGYLVDGQPARFPSINTRSERLHQQRTGLGRRVIVPATEWYEMHKPDRSWWRFAGSGRTLLAMAGVTRPGRTAEGVEVTCYSIVMRPAADALASIHDRMPLLIPTDFADQWLGSHEPAAELIDQALAASQAVSATVGATPMDTRP